MSLSKQGRGAGQKWVPVQPEWTRATSARLERARERAWEDWYGSWDRWWNEAEGTEPTAGPDAPAANDDRVPAWSFCPSKNTDPYLDDATNDFLAHRLLTAQPASYAPQEKLYMCFGRPVMVLADKSTNQSTINAKLLFTIPWKHATSTRTRHQFPELANQRFN